MSGTYFSLFLTSKVNPFSEIVKAPTASYIHESGRGLLRTFSFPNGRSFYSMYHYSKDTHKPHRGQIHHIQSATPSGRTGADLIFREYQTDAVSEKLKFRRWPMRAVSSSNMMETPFELMDSIQHKCRPFPTNWSRFFPNAFDTLPQYIGRGVLLTNYFSHNSEFCFPDRYTCLKRTIGQSKRENRIRYILISQYSVIR